LLTFINGFRTYQPAVETAVCLPRHRNAKGVLRIDQVIHALGIVGDRELDALGLAVERVARGARAMISNSLLWRFFRWCE
jgi:hypothetical protein